MSMLSRANPSPGGRRALLSSLNITGSRALEPYTSEVDFSTTRRTDGVFWQAAKSWIAPITLSSFNVARPPDRGARDVTRSIGLGADGALWKLGAPGPSAHPIPETLDPASFDALVISGGTIWQTDAAPDLSALYHRFNDHGRPIAAI